MTPEALGLGGVAVLVLGASLAVVLARNLFHSVLWLALALVGTAGLFVLLHADFLAAVQVLLYAGGVVTIVVFAIMLTERLVGSSLRQTNRGVLAGAIAAGGRLRRPGGHDPAGAAPEWRPRRPSRPRPSAKRS